MKKNPKQFGNALREIRILKRRTLADLADAIGTSIVYVSDIERNRRNPPTSAKIRKLLRALDSLDKLPQMLLLAARSRKTIKIDVHNKADDVASMLVALARRVDEGTLDRKVIMKITKILEDQDGAVRADCPTTITSKH